MRRLISFSGQMPACTQPPLFAEPYLQALLNRFMIMPLGVIRRGRAPTILCVRCAAAGQEVGDCFLVSFRCSEMQGRAPVIVRRVNVGAMRDKASDFADIAKTRRIDELIGPIAAKLCVPLDRGPSFSPVRKCCRNCGS